MKDFTGKPIEVGDTVAYSRSGTASLFRGKVIKITTVRVCVDLVEHTYLHPSPCMVDGCYTIIIEKGIKS